MAIPLTQPSGSHSKQTSEMGETRQSSVQAVLMAGDRGASRAVRGTSKPFLPVGGKPMVIHVLEALLYTPEVSEVFVVGDPKRLDQCFAEFGAAQLMMQSGKPVHIVPQRRSLYENVWHAFLRARPASPPNVFGAVVEADRDHAILAVPCDIPLVVPEELSEFLAQAFAVDADYVVGLTPAEAMTQFGSVDGSEGIEMACFNLAEGRYRQSNLHYVKPLRLENRHYVQDVYETRYQKEWGNTLRLALKIFFHEFRNVKVLFFYALMLLAGWLDRRGRTRMAAFVRRYVSLRRAERCLSDLIRGRLVTVVTALGGAAIDVDNEADLVVLEKRLEEWKAQQIRRARALAPQRDRDASIGANERSHS